MMVHVMSGPRVSSRARPSREATFPPTQAQPATMPVVTSTEATAGMEARPPAPTTAEARAVPAKPPAATPAAPAMVRDTLAASAGAGRRMVPRKAIKTTVVTQLRQRIIENLLGSGNGHVYA